MLRPIAMALIHYPVVDRRGNLVTSAVTNLDIHDLARLATTYGLSRLYLVTPVLEQQHLVQRIIRHWSEGFGASYNRDRSQALRLVKVCNDYLAALEDWRRLAGDDMAALLTGARQRQGLGFRHARKVAQSKPLLIFLGTGHGLAEEFYDRGWAQLLALRVAGYNHLSVRTAAAIILDRLVGERGRPLIV
ncbi:MAG: RNA methyltransferase [Deltaproteobacteria bacterium]|nr:RNA methyltransferase [Deltaproteobacteria bacterium]